MADEKKKKRPKDRKNPGMADKYKAERKAKNAQRSKQRWVPTKSYDFGGIDNPIVLGHWERP
jgi:hypothetical protein